MKRLDYTIYNKGTGGRGISIEPKTIKKSLIEALLSTEVILISTLALCCLVSPTIANYCITKTGINEGKSKVQIEKEFNSLKESKEYPHSGKIADFLFNSKPQKSGRDLSYYLNKK